MGIDLRKNNSGEEPKKESKINLSKNTNTNAVPNDSSNVLQNKSEFKESKFDPQKSSETKDSSAKKGSGKWIVVAIILIAVVGLIYMFSKGGNKPNGDISKSDKNITVQKNDNPDSKTDPTKDVKDPTKDVKDPTKDVNDPGKDVKSNDKNSDGSTDTKNSGNDAKDKSKDINQTKDPNKVAKDLNKDNNPANDVSKDNKQKKGSNTSDDKQNKLNNDKQNKTQNNIDTKIDDYDNIANFVPSGTKLTKKSIIKLNKLVKQLKDNKNLSATVKGYTDNKGSDELNKILSEKRAKIVYNYLLKRGIDASRLKSTGEGPSNPISDNSTPEGRYKNRRVSVNLK
ncbi:MAG: OmpA family protein [Ignavibacteria bacterium]